MKPTDYFDQFCKRYEPYKGGAWCYEDGCVYRGLTLLLEATGESRWLGHLVRLIEKQVSPDGSLAGYDAQEYNIDNILPGRTLLFMAARTQDPRYMVAARRLIGQLDEHPRIHSGNYWHKKRYPRQVWLDGLYMALPFQIDYALATGETPRIADALRQFAAVLDLTATDGGLYVHGYDESREQGWSDATTGKSAAVWARAVGWLAMALVDVAALLPDDQAMLALRARTRDILLAVADRQRPSGLWQQVIDQPDLAGNYEESSASAMFAYALLRAARLGLVGEEDAGKLHASGMKALEMLTRTRLTEDDGIVRFNGICQVAGLGALSGPYRDGSPSYYLTEAVVADDAKGVGPLMMAVAEWQLAGGAGALRVAATA